MEKLFIDGYYPGAIAAILSFLSPQTCVLKKNTDGTRIQCVSQKFNNIIPPTFKNDSPCAVVGPILDKNRCRFHCKAFPIYVFLDNRIKREKDHEYIHFGEKSHAKFMLYHKPDLIGDTCCGGKGYRWRNPPLQDRWRLDKINSLTRDMHLV